MERFMAMHARFPVGVNKKNQPIFIAVNFRDSFQILNSSLAKLIKSVGPDSMKQTYKMTQIYNVSEDVVKAKGVFPYSFFDDYTKMNNHSLPPIASFYDTLRDEHITDTEYAMVHRAWREFNCQNFGEYMLRYLEMDVRQLCDVFEHFRKITRSEDGLDGSYFITISQFFMSATLKPHNKIIDLCPTPEMYRFF